jgi:GNAT superfamily N-acetyltransferase
MAAVFRECMPYSIFGRVGGKVLNAYFRYYCTSQSAEAIVAQRGMEIVGACMGTTHSAHHHYWFYRENGIHLIKAVVMEAFTRPQILRLLSRHLRARILQVLRTRLAHARIARESLQTTLPDPRKTCHLALFYVAPSARGQGVGSEMLRRFCATMALKGFQWCRGEAGRDNIASQIAQDRAGFQCMGVAGDDVVLLGRIGEDIRG